MFHCAFHVCTKIYICDETDLIGFVFSLLLVSISCLSSLVSGAFSRYLFSRSNENRSHNLDNEGFTLLD